MTSLNQPPPKVSPSRIALLLVGAGARGIYTCGMLKAFHETRGFNFDEIYMCSSGSLNGAIFAQGDLDLLEHIWMTISNKDVRRFNPLKIWGKEACFYDNAPLAKTLRKYVDIAKIQAKGKPVYVALTSLSDSSTVRYRLDLGEAGVDPIDALVASASPPLLADPININGTWFYDGGCSDDYGLEAAALNGATELIAMHPNRPGAWNIRNIFDAHDFMMSVPMWNNYLRQRDSLAAFPEAIRPAFIEIVPEHAMPGTIYDFDFKGLDRKALIKIGYDLALRALQQ